MYYVLLFLLPLKSNKYIRFINFEFISNLTVVKSEQYIIMHYISGLKRYEKFAIGI